MGASPELPWKSDIMPPRGGKSSAKGGSKKPPPKGPPEKIEENINAKFSFALLVLMNSSCIYRQTNLGETLQELVQADLQDLVPGTWRLWEMQTLIQAHKQKVDSKHMVNTVFFFSIILSMYILQHTVVYVTCASRNTRIVFENNLLIHGYQTMCTYTAQNISSH